MNLTYALLFLPLITGVLASAICRYEHQAGGWKQLVSLPVTRMRQSVYGKVHHIDAPRTSYAVIILGCHLRSRNHKGTL